ncbi:MAG: TonB-dependent receptor [Candidatus Kapabacteria bacterium]|nr:TonB-dependent receptor [Candidatus Kapabacteria bacterium]
MKYNRNTYGIKRSDLTVSSSREGISYSAIPNLFKGLGTGLMNLSIILFSIILIYCNSTLAQTPTEQQSPPQQPPKEKPEEKASKPIELPAIVIDGIEQLDVRSGIKQYPKNTRAMNKSELDSINTLDKLQPFLLPEETLPEKNSLRKFNNGYLIGEIGRYVSADIDAGYDFNILNNKWFARAALDYSSGHVNNSENFKFLAHLGNEFIAPDSFLLFGNSMTKFNLDILNKNYKLYGSYSAPKRALTNIDLGAHSEGYYEGFRFFTGADISTIQMRTTDVTSPEYSLESYLKIYNSNHQYKIGFSGVADFHSNNGHGTHFLEAAAIGMFELSEIKFDLMAGFQTAGNSNSIERSGFKGEIQCQYKINREFSFNGKITSGLKNNNLMNLLYNPYLIDSAVVDYAYNLFDINLSCYYHPNRFIGISTGARLASTHRTPYYLSQDSAFYMVKYGNCVIGEIFVEGFYDFDKNTSLVFNTEFKFTDLENGKNLPYFSPLNVSINIKHNWSNDFGTIIGVNYCGARAISDTSNSRIDGFFGLNLNAEYKIDNRTKVYLDVRNLSNSSIYVWNYYKERDIYVALGANWQF